MYSKSALLFLKMKVYKYETCVTFTAQINFQPSHSKDIRNHRLFEL